MIKIIPRKTINRFVFFIIIWFCIFFFTLIYDPIFGNNNERGLFSIFSIIIRFPVFITNILQNINTLNSIDMNYFWHFNLGTNILWRVLFWLFACLYFSLTLTLLYGDNERIKNIILKLHLGFFTIVFISEAVQMYLSNPQDPKFIITIGPDNFVVLLGHIINITIYLYILTRIKKEVDLKFLKNTFKNYLFTITEVLLSLFIGLTFYKYIKASDASKISYISYLLGFVLYGFFIFLLIQLFRIRFKEQ